MARAGVAAAKIMRPSARGARRRMRRNVSCPRSTYDLERAYARSEAHSRCAINDTNARKIKGFPPTCPELYRQHDFANMFAGFHPPMRIGSLFQRESAVNQRL